MKKVPYHNRRSIMEKKIVTTERRMTHSQFVEFIHTGKKGATFATFKATTDPGLKKTGNPYSGVIKVSVVNGCIGFDYENSVNNAQERAGELRDFVAQERKWGKRISRAFVEHKGAFYLTVKVEKSVEPARYFDGNGVEIAKEALEPFMRPLDPTTVIYRDYKLDSIDRIRINGHDILIMHD